MAGCVAPGALGTREMVVVIISRLFARELPAGWTDHLPTWPQALLWARPMNCWPIRPIPIDGGM